jgi:hypothetical protein
MMPLAKIIISILDIHCVCEFSVNALEAAHHSVSAKLRANNRAKVGPHNVLSAYHHSVQMRLTAPNNTRTYWQILDSILTDGVCIFFSQPRCSTNPCSPKSIGPGYGHQNQPTPDPDPLCAP